jgi:hypothetical protein
MQHAVKDPVQNANTKGVYVKDHFQNANLNIILL